MQNLQALKGKLRNVGAAVESPSAIARRGGILLFLLLFSVLSLALGGCGGGRADFDEDAYYQRRMAEMRAQSARRRESKQDMLDAYNRRVVTTNTLEIQPIETELLTSGNSAAAAPYPGGPVPAVVIQDSRDPYDHVQGKSRTGTRRTQQVIRHADGSTEVITEEEGIYRDRVVPKTEIQAP